MTHSLVTAQKEEGAQAQVGAQAFAVSPDDQQASKCCEDIAYVTITYVPQTSKGMCGALPEAGRAAKVAPPVTVRLAQRNKPRKHAAVKVDTPGWDRWQCPSRSGIQRCQLEKQGRHLWALATSAA